MGYMLKDRILFHPRIPDIYIFIRDYAARDNISFRDHSVISSACWR